MFQTLHTMFEEQYTELATAIDEVAERIRSLGAFAPGSFSTYAELSSIKEEKGVPAAKEMIAQLVSGHETVIKTARSLYPLCDLSSDDATADLLTARIRVHEKTAWMLRSCLKVDPGQYSARRFKAGAANPRVRRNAELIEPTDKPLDQGVEPNIRFSLNWRVKNPMTTKATFNLAGQLAGCLPNPPKQSNIEYANGRERTEQSRF